MSELSRVTVDFARTTERGEVRLGAGRAALLGAWCVGDALELTDGEVVVEAKLTELHPEMCAKPFWRTVKHDKLRERAELQALRDQVTRLQTRGTELVNELRDVDRQRMVREFHAVVCEQKDPDGPTIPDEATVRLRARLITEEYLECMEALFGAVVHGTVADHLGEIVDQGELLVDLPAFIDATVDIEYITEGTRLAFGVDSRAVWALVQKANMAKAGGPRRESDGKRLKPAGWQPPDIAGELARQVEAAKKRQRGPA